MKYLILGVRTGEVCNLLVKWKKYWIDNNVFQMNLNQTSKEPGI